MSTSPEDLPADWYWGTSEGSRAFDRIVDRSLSFREKLEWLEEAETLSMRFEASRKQIQETRRDRDARITDKLSHEMIYPEFSKQVPSE